MKKIVLFLGLLFLSFGAWAQESSLSEEVTDDSLKIYSLGEVEVMGNRPGKLVSAKVTSAQLLEFNRTNVTEALNLLPGLSITEAGARNEGQIYMRGFNLLQTPIFYDGIPIYVPYDGNVDINRFTTYDLSQVSVSKALTSVLYGPNTMGGAINIISRKPVKTFEAWGMSGLKASGDGLNGYNTSLSVGSKMESSIFSAVRRS